MDAYLNIIGLRTVREYSNQAISPQAITKILQAGRSTGSSRNSQPWRFYVLNGTDLANLAVGVFAPENVESCQFAIVIVSPRGGYDVGRCSQNMMLAAWADGIGSSPNGVKDADHINQYLGLQGEETASIVMSFGYPKKTRRSADVEGMLSRINRKPLDELVVWFGQEQVG